MNLSTTATPEKTTTLIAVKPPTEQPKFESTSFSVGDTLVAFALIAAIAAAIRSLIQLTTQAHQLKSSFEQRDLLLNNKLDNLIDSIDKGFTRIDKEYERLDKRFNRQAGLIGQIMTHLAKQGFTLNYSRPDEDL